MSNPLVAAKQDSTTWHTGLTLIDDASSVYSGIESGSWIEGGIGALGAGLDLLTMAMNPVGTLISYGLNWLIEHVKPLQDALNHLAGDADQIAAYAQTWKNVGAAAAKCANAIGTVVQVVGVITGAVRALVRDMVTQAIGDFIQDALEEVFSLGLGTPVVVARS